MYNTCMLYNQNSEKFFGYVSLWPTFVFFLTKSRQGSMSHSNMSLMTSPLSLCITSLNDSIQDLTIGRQPRVVGSRYTIPHRLTVAG